MFSVRSYSFVQFGPCPPVKEIFIRYHVNCCICSFNIFNSVLRAERNFTASIPQLFHYFTKVRRPKRQGFQDVREAYGHRPGTRRSSFGERAAAANGAELRSGSGGTLVQLLATRSSILLATATATCHQYTITCYLLLLLVVVYCYLLLLLLLLLASAAVTCLCYLLFAIAFAT